MKNFRVLTFAATLAVLVLGALTVPMLSDAPATAEKASAPLASPTAKTTAEKTTSENDAAEDARRAEEVLADLASTYEHLEGVSVVFGTTPRGEEAVAYYQDGEILISTAHTVDVKTILEHEVWHVIDWRDNGRIDWGEDLPPSNTADYL